MPSVTPPSEINPPGDHPQGSPTLEGMII